MHQVGGSAARLCQLESVSAVRIHEAKHTEAHLTSVLRHSHLAFPEGFAAGGSRAVHPSVAKMEACRDVHLERSWGRGGNLPCCVNVKPMKARCDASSSLGDRMNAERVPTGRSPVGLCVPSRNGDGRWEEGKWYATRGLAMKCSFLRSFAGRRVFVTGHTGFKGSWLCLWLDRAGAIVTGYALEPPTRPNNFTVCNCANCWTAITSPTCGMAPRLDQGLKEADPDVVVIWRPSRKNAAATKFDGDVRRQRHGPPPYWTASASCTSPARSWS